MVGMSPLSVVVRKKHNFPIAEGRRLMRSSHQSKGVTAEQIRKVVKTTLENIFQNNSLPEQVLSKLETTSDSDLQGLHGSCNSLSFQNHNYVGQAVIGFLTGKLEISPEQAENAAGPISSGLRSLTSLTNV